MSGGMEVLSSGSTARFRLVLASALAGLAAAIFVCLPTPSHAATPERFLKETFGSAAQPSFVTPQSVAIDSSSGDLLVMDGAAGTISRFKADGSPDAFSALGTNVISEVEGRPLLFGNWTQSQIAVDNSGTATDGNIYVTDWGDSNGRAVDIFKRSGEYVGHLNEAGGAPLQTACGVAVDPTGAVYVGDSGSVDKFVPTSAVPSNNDFESGFATSAPESCLIAAGEDASAGAVFVENFNSGEVRKLDAATGDLDYVAVPGSTPVGALTVVSGSGNLVVAGQGSRGSSASAVRELDVSGSSQPALVATFQPESEVQGVAGSSSAVYTTQIGASKLQVFSKAFPLPELEPVDGVGSNQATLRGIVSPVGEQLLECKFEYGLSTSFGFESSVPCSPSAAQIPADELSHAVTAQIVGLESDRDYRARLTVANSSAVLHSEVLTFGTFGVPHVSELRARDASRDSVTIEGAIDPNGLASSYHFEWGKGGRVEGRSPEVGEKGVDAGGATVTVPLENLPQGTRFTFHLVVSNVDGTEDAEGEFETLDECGLPDQRCLELVSPSAAGPVAVPGQISNEEIPFQAASRAGALIYSVANGLPGTTKGAEVLYRGERQDAGWPFPKQFSPPVEEERSESFGGTSLTAVSKGISSELDCGITETNQFLPGTEVQGRTILEDGGTNLYRQNQDGSYTLITNVPPLNAEEVILAEGGMLTYTVLGFSENCRRVFFQSPYRYPGVAAIGQPPFTSPQPYVYEWSEGKLRNVAFLPSDSSGAQEEVGPGAISVGARGTNAITSDGTRVFFGATRLTGSDSEEVGTPGVFVREGETTRDVSLSQTSTPDLGASYQYASPDGSHVFFTANSGLTTVSSPSGTDLYEYNLDTGDLVDLSVAQEGAADVFTVFGTSEDGSRVYFAARGQLVANRGATFAENAAAGTYSIYAAENGTLAYVGAFAASEQGSQSSDRVTADGRFFLFQTALDITGYQSGGVREAYLYSADGPESIVCISCRQDGEPSVSPRGNYPLGEDRLNLLHPPMRLVERNGKPLVFFVSQDELAPGASTAQANLYEWAHGQVFHIASEPPGLQGPPNGEEVVEQYIEFAGASEASTDLYFVTPGQLTWEDPDQRKSVYDARIGGGHAEPPGPTAPCNPTAEGSCQGGSPSPIAAPPASSGSFTGPANPVRCRKGFTRKQHRCVKAEKKKKKRHAPKKKHGRKRADGKAGRRGAATHDPERDLKHPVAMETEGKAGR
jgi:hypothetical protein